MRGKKVGSWLIEKLQKKALKNEQIHDISLECISYNKEALKFYQKLGFEKMAKRYDYYDFGGELFDAEILVFKAKN